MTVSHVAAAAVLLLSASAMSAQAATDANGVAPTPAAQPAPLRTAQNSPDPNTQICKHVEEIGSRLGGSKVCHTRAEWDDIAHHAGDALNTLQTAGNHMSPSGH